MIHTLNQRSSSPSCFGRLLALSALVLSVGAAGLAGGCEVKVTDADIEPITLPALRKVMEDERPDRWVLVDSRSAAEHERGRIPGSINRPLATVSGRKADIDPALGRYSTIVVYGNNPGSAPAKAVTKRLLASGYSGVFMYFGGLEEWRRTGLPVEGTGEVPAATPATPATPPTPAPTAPPSTK
jgi:rhodanese-related sulfurtransferase